MAGGIIQEKGQGGAPPGNRCKTNKVQSKRIASLTVSCSKNVLQAAFDLNIDLDVAETACGSMC